MKSRLTADSWILNRPIAHRGLWTEELAENSMSAYKAAIEHNYPIEMDVQMSKDGVLYCFHDDNMKRMTGADIDIRETNSTEIEKLKIGGEHIPTFDEFLRLVKGQVPILIEIKKQKYKGVEQKVLDALKGYTGEIAIQSFDPTVMLKIKKLDKTILRGQLGVKMTTMSRFNNFVVTNLALNFLVRPDFVHYYHECLPLKRRISNGLPVICYTIQNKEQENRARKYVKNFVFDHYEA